jgi:hypothetical protein
MTEPLDREALQTRWQANENELSRILAAPQLDQIMLAARVEELETEQDRIQFQFGQSPDELGEDPEPFVVRYRDLVNCRDESTGAAACEQLNVEIRQMGHRWKAWQGEDSLQEMAFGEPVE